MSMVDLIQAVINTLNQVTVSGADNLNKLLSSIQALTNIKSALQNPAPQPVEGGEKNDSDATEGGKGAQP